MKNTSRALSFLFLLIFAVAPAIAQQVATTAPVQQRSISVSNKVQLVIEGKVISVHDGDTVTVLDKNNKKTHIRLQGIDAPEVKQAFGPESQQFLARIVLDKQVTIVWTKLDKYRRTVGTIMLDGRDINIEVVKAGLAWHFKKYADEQPEQDRITYAAAEREARAAKLGLWVDPNPMQPGDWRAEVKTKRWGPPPPEGTIIGNRNSKKYHRPDCSGYRDMAEKNRVFFKTVEEAEAAGYKRAGNCPAEDAMVTTPATKSSPSTSASSSPAPVATRSVAIDPRPVAAIAAESAAPGKIVGNKNSHIYHLPTCSDYDKVSEKNRVFFDNEADAEKAGYRKAKNCH